MATATRPVTEDSLPIADAEVIPPELENSLAVIPGSLTDLSQKLDKGLEIVKARAVILETARRAAISMTSPEDWLLFKDRDGRIVGYLQDSGCDRVRDIYGIEVFAVSRPEKIQISNEEFMYVISGSGRCHLTGQVVEGIEGGRSSTDDYIVQQKPPLKGYQMELAVRKAARANLDGGITRALAGLQSIPLDEILKAYEGDPKKTRDRFREGRGFGSGAERQGAKISDNAPVAEKPKCPECNGPTNFKSGKTKEGKPYTFYSCAKYPNCKGSWDAEEWKKELEIRRKAAAEEPEPQVTQ